MDNKTLLALAVCLVLLVVAYFYFYGENFKSHIYTSGATQRFLSEFSSTNQEAPTGKYLMHRRAEENRRAESLAHANAEMLEDAMRADAAKDAKIASGDMGTKDVRRFSVKKENFATDDLASNIKEAVLKDKLITPQGKSGYDYLLQDSLYDTF